MRTVRNGEEKSLDDMGKTPSDVTVEIMQTALPAAKEGSSGQDSLSQSAGIRQRLMLLQR